MRATLSYTLPEDQIEFRNASDAGKAFSLISQISEDIRHQFKYGSDLTNTQLLVRIRQDIYEMFPDLDER